MDPAAKRQQQADEARAALDAAVADVTVVDEPAQVDEPAAAVDEPATIIPDASADTQPNPEIARLQAEVSRLTARLDDENSPTYKSRWDALKGQFNARGTEIDTLMAKVAKLEQKLEEKAKQPGPPAPKMEEDPEYLILVEEVGEKAAKVIYRQQEELKTIKGQLGGVDEELKATKGKTEKIEGETGQIKERQASTEAERYAARIAQAVPDWNALMGTPDKEYADQAPKFTEFLQKSVRGKTNFQSLADAHNSGDIATVKEIFDEGRVYAGVTVKPTPAPTAKPSSKADKFIEPGKTGQGTQEPTGVSEMIPESEIKALSTAIRMQTFKGTKAELDALKEKHRKARIEGRVIEGR